MRQPRLSSRSIHAAAALLIFGALAPGLVTAQAQQAAQPPAQAPSAAPGPYKPVPVTLPPAMNDPSFDTFRKQLTQIGQQKDRTSLARLVAASFFWVPEDTDVADKSKSAIDNLAKALNLNGADASGWEAIIAYAAEIHPHAGPAAQGRILCAG